MEIEVFLTSFNVTDEDVKDRTVVVIDVLRASATIITALQNGARDVVPVADMAAAGKLASNLDPTRFLLGGERGGDKIAGYHLGNSPLEYTEATVKGRTIIFTTTNGTYALDRSRSARHLLVGSFLNAERVVDFIRKADRDVTIVCAGRRKRVNLEDTLCAGLMLYRLWDGTVPDEVSDAAYIAFTQYVNDKDRLQTVLQQCNHAQWLATHGYQPDVDYCTRLDVIGVLPYYRENRLILANGMLEEGGEIGRGG